MTSAADPDGVIDRALQTARELTGMDLAFVGHFDDGRELIRSVAGDAGRFGLAIGDGPELDASYCQRMVDGRLERLVPDTAGDPEAAGLPVTAEAGIGAYLGVPLRRRDGSLYGTFCCLAGEAREDIGERHVRLMEALAHLVGDQLERLEAVDAAQRAQREFFASVSHDVPGEPVRLEGDAPQLRRVLDNLLSNAVKYSPAGGPVDVRLRTDRSTAVLEVADGGIGIPPAEVEHLFTRFFRASTARARDIPGTGLGLAICRSIVAAHEGTITVESAVDAGTTVRLRLPLARR